MWRRRKSWNDGSVSYEDIPANKINKFQSVVRKGDNRDYFYQATMSALEPTAGKTKRGFGKDLIKKVMETVRRRKEDILSFRAAHADELQENVDVIDVRDLDEIIKITYEWKEKRKQQQKDFFVEKPKPILKKKEEEDNVSKKIIQDILKMIQKLEDTHRKQMFQDEAVVKEPSADQLEELQVITPVIRRKSSYPVRVIGAKVDSGLRRRYPGSRFEIYYPRKEEMTHTSDKEIEVRIGEYEKSTAFSEDEIGYDKKFVKVYGIQSTESIEESREDLDEESEELLPETSYFRPPTISVIPLAIEEEPKRVKIKRELKIKKSKSDHKKTFKQVTSGKLLPAIKVIGFAENPDSLLEKMKSDKELPAVEDKQKEETENLVENTESETTLPTPPSDDENVFDDEGVTQNDDEVVIAQKEKGRSLFDYEDRMRLRVTVENILDEIALEMEDEKTASLLSLHQREVRTADDKRYSSKIEKQPLKESGQTYLIVKALGGEDTEVLTDNVDRTPEKVKRRRKASLAKHAERISNERKRGTEAVLVRRTSGLPDSLRYQYFKNFLKQGGEAEVYVEVQNKQKSQMRFQMEYIMNEALKRLSDVHNMKDEALRDEIEALEEQVRKTTRPESVEKEEERRKMLKSSWEKTGVIDSSEYWRKPPKGKEIVMKEYIRETTFDDILAQRGHFGKKVQRPKDSFYMPVDQTEMGKKLSRDEKADLFKITAISPVKKKEVAPEDSLKTGLLKQPSKDNLPQKEPSKLYPAYRKTETLEDVNKVKQVVYNPFTYSSGDHKGPTQIQTFLPEEKTTSDVRQVQIRVAAKPSEDLNKPKHRLANKTNRGFLKSFTEST